MICIKALLLLLVIVTFSAAEDVPELLARPQRWLPYGEPYQQSYVSLLPGRSQTPWPPITPYPAESGPQFIWNSQNQMPMSPTMWSPPSLSLPPGQPTTPPVMFATPMALLPQEQSSRDLDIGLYTGMDSPWTQLPPFSRTFSPGAVQYLPATSEWNSKDMGFYNGVENGGQLARNQIYPWTPPYPWMRQQGGFAVRPSENDLKLTMHVPKDGVPGGVLVMEMKASVYRPVY